MFEPPLRSILPVFSNDRSELNASAPVAAIARSMQAKHFVDFVATFPLLAAILKGSSPVFGNTLCTGQRSTCQRAESYQ
jgi:hypothetical protein